MQQRTISILAGLVLLYVPAELSAQCTLNNATTCVCKASGQNDCDLLPDLTISWYGLQHYAGGPNEYSQSHSSQAGRLKISGSTPNIGHGPLEVRTVSGSGQRAFICGNDTFNVAQSQTNFTCPNGQDPKQIIYQNVYHKSGDQMQTWERMAGSMTYHAAHSHYHVNDWTTMTLRLQEEGVTDPLQWPVVATGAKIGFCLMDYGTCSTYNGHCRTSQEYGGGTVLTTPQFPNNGLNGNYGCGTNVQGISVGRTDIYSESLDMMWINIMPDLCNGNYWIVAEVDPTDVFLEEDDDNNWTAIPFAITQQRAPGSGGTAGIFAPDGTRVPPGGSIRLTATPGNSYLWSTGATTRTIHVSNPGNYSVQVTQPCGVLNSGDLLVTSVTPPAPPTGNGAELDGPGTAQIGAIGNGTIKWYGAATGGSPIATGPVFDTPYLSETTTYYASNTTTLAGSSSYGGKTSLSGSQNSSSVRQWLYFDAYEPFELRSVKVYANGNGERHFVLTDNVGSVLDEKVVYVPNGTHRVDLDFQVPAGTNHRITAFDDNSEIVLALHRDNSGVSYPYSIGSYGAITGSSAGGSYYYFLYDWEVGTPDLEMESTRTAVTVTITDGVSVLLKTILEGPYNGQTGLMGDALRTGGHLPLIEPFSSLGFTHAGDGGGEVMDGSLLNTTGSHAVVDWLLVELRDPVQPAQVVSTRSALLKRNGDVVSSTGETIRFPVSDGLYHIAIRHRNHMGIMTATPIQLGSSATLLDMTSSSVATWGSNARKSMGGVMAQRMGNVVNDGNLKYTGSSNDRDPILSLLGGVIPTLTTNGYHVEDVNLDGMVRYTGSANDRDPILQNVGGLTPTAILLEQLP